MTVLCIVVVNPKLFGTKWISMKHPKTGEQIRVNLRTISVLPRQLYFDPKVYSDFMRVKKLCNLSSVFALMYVTNPKISTL